MNTDASINFRDQLDNDFDTVLVIRRIRRAGYGSATWRSRRR